jgi:hypothetical protein
MSRRPAPCLWCGDPWCGGDCRPAREAAAHATVLDQWEGRACIHCGRPRTQSTHPQHYAGWQCAPCAAVDPTAHQEGR